MLAPADRIIDGSNPKEPVHIHCHGDDLLTPVERCGGLLIGNLTTGPARSKAGTVGATAPVGER